MHPGPPTWQGPPGVHDGSKLPGAVCAHDDAEQNGPETAFSAPHTRAYRTG